MRLVYVDTGYLIALIWRRDRAHGAARAHFERARAARDRMLTADAVIGETATRLRYDAGSDAVATFGRVIEAAVGDGSLRIRESDADLRNAALGTMIRFSDRPLSYADAVGAAVAHEAGTDVVFGFDDDFRILGFTVEP